VEVEVEVEVEVVVALHRPWRHRGMCSTRDFPDMSTGLHPCPELCGLDKAAQNREVDDGACEQGRQVWPRRHLEDSAEEGRGEHRP
jgi:hypothetical protein